MPQPSHVQLDSDMLNCEQQHASICAESNFHRTQDSVIQVPGQLADIYLSVATFYGAGLPPFVQYVLSAFE